MADLRAVSTHELTVKQIKEIEYATGTPMNQWGRSGSLLHQCQLIVAAVNGVDPETLDDLKAADLVPLVGFGKAKARDPNPSGPTSAGR